MLHSQQNRMEESPKIDRGLAPKNPGTYLRNGAMTLDNLRMLHSQQSRMEESRKEYEEAPKIDRELAPKSSETHRRHLAKRLKNLMKT